MISNEYLTRIRFREDTALNWRIANPVLSSSEPGREIDTGLIKVGDGKTHWNDLDYINDSADVFPEVPNDGKLYGRIKNGSSVGTWQEIVHPADQVTEAPDTGKLYGRDGSTHTWIEIDTDDERKADIFETEDFVNIETTSTNVLKINNSNKACNVVIKYGEIYFTLAYTETNTIELRDMSNGILNVLYDGEWKNANGIIVDNHYAFDYLTKELTFENAIEIVQIDTDLFDTIQIKTTVTKNLVDVYNTAINNITTVKTLDDLFAADYNQRIDFNKEFTSFGGTKKRLYGIKLHHVITEENSETNTIDLLENVDRVYQYGGTIKDDVFYKALPNKDVEILLKDNKVSLLTTSPTARVNDEIDIWLVYTII